MTAIFADAGYFIALLHRGDELHARALALTDELRRPVVTTNFVLAEVGNFLGSRPGRAEFRPWLLSLIEDPDFDVVHADAALFRRGLSLYGDRPDKAWSLTDCISFVVMGDRGVTDALTGDRHFVQAGFAALLL